MVRFLNDDLFCVKSLKVSFFSFSVCFRQFLSSATLQLSAVRGQLSGGIETIGL